MFAYTSLTSAGASMSSSLLSDGFKSPAWLWRQNGGRWRCAARQIWRRSAAIMAQSTGDVRTHFCCLLWGAMWRAMWRATWCATLRAIWRNQATSVRRAARHGAASRWHCRWRRAAPSTMARHMAPGRLGMARRHGAPYGAIMVPCKCAIIAPCDDVSRALRKRHFGK